MNLSAFSFVIEFTILMYLLHSITPGVYPARVYVPPSQRVVVMPKVHKIGGSSLSPYRIWYELCEYNVTNTTAGVRRKFFFVEFVAVKRLVGNFECIFNLKILPREKKQHHRCTVPVYNKHLHDRQFPYFGKCEF